MHRIHGYACLRIVADDIARALQFAQSTGLGKERAFMQQLVRIGCAAGFAGDRADAALPIIGELASHRGPRFLMFETLAERTLALCQLEKRRDPARGYSPALDRMLPGTLGPCLENGIRIIGNFGAANPRAAGERIAALARAAGFPRPRIAVIEGDDVSNLFSTEELAARQIDGKVLGPCANIVAANVYLGAEPIARAFDEGAEIVVTGRVADPALALGPLVHAHRWIGRTGRASLPARSPATSSNAQARSRVDILLIPAARMCPDWRSSAIPSPRSSPRVSSSSPSRSGPEVSWTGARSPSRFSTKCTIRPPISPPMSFWTSQTSKPCRSDRIACG